MSTLQAKLARLVKKIKNQSYKIQDLENISKLQAKIAQNIKATNSGEAIALLGHLLKYEYAKIDPNEGILLNSDPQKAEDIKILLELN